MFRILCDPSSGNTELCFVGVWQRNFEPVVCVYGPAGRTVPLAVTPRPSPRFSL